MSFNIRRFDGFAALPPDYDALRAQLASAGLFGDPAWFELLMTQVFDLGDRLCLYGVEPAAGGAPLLLAPLRASRHDGAMPGAQVVGSISHPENFAEAAFAFAPGCSQPEAVAAALFRALRAGGPETDGRPVDVIRLWPLALDGELGNQLFAALQDAGYWVQAYANSHNQYEDTAGLDHAAYFEQRSANLRYSVRRRRRALEKTGALERVLVREPDGLEAALPDYVAVSQASWKTPVSMHSTDMLALMRLSAQRGILRLGLLRVDGVAAAVQFWLVSGGTAHCVRLAYDEAFKKQAVGVVLTDFMIAQVLDGDRAQRIDFGYGDDEYKSGWMKQQRLYFGLLAFNRRSPRGWGQALRHLGGRPLKRALKALLQRLGLRRGG